MALLWISLFCLAFFSSSSSKIAATVATGCSLLNRQQRRRRRLGTLSTMLAKRKSVINRYEFPVYRPPPWLFSFSSFSSLSSTTVGWSAESSCKLGLLNPLLSLTGSLGWNSINNHRTQVTWCVRSSLVSQPRRRASSSSAMMRKKGRRRRRLISAHTKEPTSSLWLEENNSQGNNIVRW